MTKSLKQQQKEKAKEYYINMLAEHQQILKKLRVISSHLLNHVAEDLSIETTEKTSPDSSRIDPVSSRNQGGEEAYPIENVEYDPSEKNITELRRKNIKNYDEMMKVRYVNSRIFSPDESLTDVIARIGRIMVRIIPLEQELSRINFTEMELDELHNVAEHTKRTQEDIDDELEMVQDYIENYNLENGWVKLDDIKNGTISLDELMATENINMSG